jgi:hypothetical protein
MLGSTLLVHLLEQSTSSSNGQIVRCGLAEYEGKQGCSCPEGMQEQPSTRDANDAYTDISRYFQHLCEEAHAALVLARQQRHHHEAAGYAAVHAGYAVSPPPAAHQQLIIDPTAVPGGYYQQQVGYAMSPPAPAPNPAVGYYTTNAYGLPVNMANGHINTERRGVHLANLSRKTRAKDLRSLMERKKIGSVLSIDVHSDGPEKCKGSAIVHLATADDANYAVGMLNDYEWLGGRKIRARLAKESAAVAGTAGPVICNGTTYGGQ